MFSTCATRVENKYKQGYLNRHSKEGGDDLRQSKIRLRIVRKMGKVTYICDLPGSFDVKYVGTTIRTIQTSGELDKRMTEHILNVEIKCTVKKLINSIKKNIHFINVLH